MTDLHIEPKNSGFKLTIPIQECYVKKSHDGDGNEIEKKYVSGIASGTELDRDTEKMAYSALEAMRSAITEGITTEKGEHSEVPLYSEHKAEELEKLGWLTKAWIEKRDDHHELWIEAELDTDNPKANLLYKKLTTPTVKSRPVQLGLSISGRVTKAYREFDTALRKSITVFEGILLKEVSVVTKPAYAPSYLEVLEKSYKEDNETVGVQVMEEELNLEAQKSEAESSTTEETTSEETTKAVSDAAESETQDETVAKTESDQLAKGAESTESEEDVAKSLFDGMTQKMSTIEALLTELKAEYATLTVNFYPRPSEKAASEQTDAGETVAKQEDETKADAPVADVVVKSEGSDLNVDVLKQALTDAISEQVSPLVTKLTELEGQLAEINSTKVDKSVAALGNDLDPKQAALQEYYRSRDEAITANKQWNPISEGVEIWKRSLSNKN